MLIWDTSPRSPPSFSSIGLCTAEKLQFWSVPNYTKQTNRHESRRAGKTKPKTAKNNPQTAQYDPETSQKCPQYGPEVAQNGPQFA
jgi:hypothetical protein